MLMLVETLTFSYVGMQTHYAQGDRFDPDNLSVVLDENANNLDQVVVAGYGTAEKKQVLPDRCYVVKMT
ncbi:MAG: hypothetical protein WKG06_14935 [Segetibacter sp.]